MKPLHISTKKHSGFSLVEIALALGIVGFSLAALLGLLATASNVNAESGRETVMVSMTSQIMTNFRAVPFDALWVAKPRADASDSSSSGMPAESIYYFTAEGALLPEDNAASDPDAVYVCTVIKTPDKASQTPGTLDNPRHNMLRLQLVYSWPVTAPATRRQTYTVHANIARY